MNAARLLLVAALPFTLSLTRPALGQAASPTAPAARPAASAALNQARERGRQLVALFYAQKLDPVWAAFSPSARESWNGDLSAFQAYRSMGVQTYGAEVEVLNEQVVEQGGVRYYVRTATFEKAPQAVWNIVFGFDATGRVAVFGIMPAQAQEESGPTA